MRHKKTIFIAFGFIALTLLFLWAEWMLGSAEKRSATSVYNHSSTGVHLFYNLAQKIKPDSIIAYQKIFKKEDLDPSVTLLIFSPRKKIKEWEAKIIQEFVQSGGRLILSFEEKSSWKNLESLVALFEGPTSNREDKGFKNYHTHSLSPLATSAFFKPGESYSFYSRYWLDRPECQNGNFECFVFEKEFGRGQVLLTAGVPLIGNSMIGRDDNRRFAFRLIHSDSKLLLDEYHHYFSDHTFGQILKKPGFAIPFFSMIACVILFFMFGHSRFHELTQIEKQKSAVQSYHSLNEKILLGVVDQRSVYPGALSFHRSFIERLFPYAKAEMITQNLQLGLEDKNAFLNQALGLVKIHQTLLEKKMGFKRRTS